MKAPFITLFLFVCFQSFGQNTWANLPQEDQAEKAMDDGNYVLAISLYEKALAIRKAKYPKGIYCSPIALKEVSTAMDHLIVANSKAGNYKKHIELCQELSAWSKKGMEVFPSKPNPYLEYGLVQIKIAESYQALDQYDKGVEVCQTLVDYFSNPENNRPFKFVAKQIVPFAHSRAGEILKDQGKLKDSATQHEKSVAAWQNTLKGLDRTLVHEEIAQQSEICVQRFAKLKDSTLVVKYAEIALKHYGILLKGDSGNKKITRKIQEARNALANYKSAWGEYEEAIEYYTKSLAIHEKQFEETRSPDDLKQMTALNLKISESYESLNNAAKSTEHLLIRIEQLKDLQALLPSVDYSFSISINQYNLAKKQEGLSRYAEALAVLDEAILWGQKAIKLDSTSTRRKEWQWVQEFFRYQLLRDMEDYKLAYSSLSRLKQVFTDLETLEPGIQYSEHIKAMEISQRELAYPDIVQLNKEIEDLEEGEMRFEKSLVLVGILKKKMRKDRSLRLPFIKHTTSLGWTGLMTGEFKIAQKALKKAMRIKPVDPYLITNYAPCLLFLGKYKKAEKVYTKYYDAPFKPGKKIIEGFVDDFKDFEENGIIPEIHREKVEEIKAQLKAWKNQ